MAKRSGLQLQVISFYRKCFRMALSKPLQSRPQFIAYVRYQFRLYSDLNHRDVNTIEYLLRKGHNSLETYSNPQVLKISIPKEAIKYLPKKEFHLH